MAKQQKDKAKASSKAKAQAQHKPTLRETQEAGAAPKEESLARLFWRGFFTPVRYLWRGLVWLIHHPPLKQIGHGLRWFFTRRPVKFIGRIIGLRFIRNSWRELRTVTWPTWKESVRLTGAVIIFAVIFGAFIAVVDYGLDKVFKQILLK